MQFYQCDRCDKVFKNKYLLLQHNTRGKNPQGCLRVQVNNLIKNVCTKRDCNQIDKIAINSQIEYLLSGYLKGDFRNPKRVKGKWTYNADSVCEIAISLNKCVENGMNNLD